MTPLDRFLRDWRIREALKHINGTPRILDIGCGDGTLLRTRKWPAAVGIDPDPRSDGIAGVRIVRGSFPEDLPRDAKPFDVITMLATFEHFEAGDQRRVARACGEVLADGGIVVASVPSRWVDPILHTLQWLHLIHGETLEEHHGFDPRTVPALFLAEGFEAVAWRRFELGLNNLFVFRKPRF